LLDAVIKHCLSVKEAFLEPLPYSEIKATAKSIATYCWKKDAYCYQEFIDRQSRKGALGGIKSNSSNGGKARAGKYTKQKIEAIELKKQGVKDSEISKILGITTRTLRNWFNK
jgi:DNA-binding transcriptional regulator YiaG